jgi:hypothetical protein
LLVPFRLVAAPPTGHAREEGTRPHHERDDGDGYIFVESDDSVSMSGSTADLREVRRLHLPAPYLWFRRGGHAYVITDKKTLARVDELFAPQRELGKVQSKLGEKQSALGEKQSELGQQQAALGQQQARLAARLAKTAGDDDDRDRRELEREMDRLGEEQGELGEYQTKLGDEQTKLGDEQSKLGEQQTELARKAQSVLCSLFDDALASGLAPRVDR